jgi:hypothetical protein
MHKAICQTTCTSTAMPLGYSITKTLAMNTGWDCNYHLPTYLYIYCFAAWRLSHMHWPRDYLPNQLLIYCCAHLHIYWFAAWHLRHLYVLHRHDS